jgi:hypothetical protein
VRGSLRAPASYTRHRRRDRRSYGRDLRRSDAQDLHRHARTTTATSAGLLRRSANRGGLTIFASLRSADDMIWKTRHRPGETSAKSRCRPPRLRPRVCALARESGTRGASAPHAAQSRTRTALRDMGQYVWRGCCGCPDPNRRLVRPGSALSLGTRQMILPRLAAGEASLMDFLHTCAERG